MDAISRVLASPQFWAIVVPVLVAAATWHFNERAKLVQEQYIRKENSYRSLIKCLRGFYLATTDPKAKADFLEEINFCWLYAPDEVILKAYEFLDGVHTGSSATAEQRQDLARELVHVIRIDMLSRKPVAQTSLKKTDFKHLSVT